MIAARQIAFGKAARGGGLPESLLVNCRFDGNVINDVTGAAGTAVNATYGVDSYGKYIRFVNDSQESYALTDEIDMTGATEFTFEIWFNAHKRMPYATVAALGRQNSLIHKANRNGFNLATSATSGGSASDGWSFYIVKATNDDHREAYSGLFPFNLDTIYYVAYELKYESGKVYCTVRKMTTEGTVLVDKTVSRTQSGILGISNDTTLSICNYDIWDSAENHINMDVYGVRVWNKTFSTTELSNSARAGIGTIVLT